MKVNYERNTLRNIFIKMYFNVKANFITNAKSRTFQMDIGNIIANKINFK